MPGLVQIHPFFVLCSHLTALLLCLQGTSGADLPSCQHPEEIWDTERGQGCHLYVRVSHVRGGHAGVRQDWGRAHRGLRWIQRGVLSWEDPGL